MKRLDYVASAMACLTMMCSAHAQLITSFFPTKNVGQFLADKFDLATMRSSLNPRARTPGLRTFSDVGMKPTKATNDVLVFDMPGDWFYEMKIVGRRDVNGDGIEDLEVCFIDRAQNGGTYNTSEGLLITRYSKDSYAVALSFQIDDDLCETYAR